MRKILSHNTSVQTRLWAQTFTQRWFNHSSNPSLQSLDRKRRQTENALQVILLSKTEAADNPLNNTYHPKNNVTDISGLLQHQTLLVEEAKKITFQLFRICLRSLRCFIPPDVSTTMKPSSYPSTEGESLFFLNAQDSFDSRYNYYLEKIREGFYQDRDCLSMMDRVPINNNTKYTLLNWRMEDIDRFVYLIQKGEEMRSWILNEYQMEDTFKKTITDRQKRIEHFEHDAQEYVQNLYRFKGWDIPQNTDRVDIVRSPLHGVDDEDIDEDDSYWDDSPRKKDI